MIYLLDRNQIIFHSVNKSEIHPALSEIAKFISLSIDYITLGNGAEWPLAHSVDRMFSLKHVYL